MLLLSSRSPATLSTVSTGTNQGVISRIWFRINILTCSCTFIYVCVCTYTCIYIYIHRWMYIHIYIHLYIYTYIYIHICLYTCIYVSTYIYTYAYMHMYTYIYAHIHTYVYMHIYTYTYVQIHIHIPSSVCKRVRGWRQSWQQSPTMFSQTLQRLDVTPPLRSMWYHSTNDPLWALCHYFHLGLQRHFQPCLQAQIKEHYRAFEFVISQAANTRVLSLVAFFNFSLCVFNYRSPRLTPGEPQTRWHTRRRWRRHPGWWCGKASSPPRLRDACLDVY